MNTVNSYSSLHLHFSADLKNEQQPIKAEYENII